MVREKKSDKELLLDFRFSNKYGQFLYERIKQRTHFERLGVTDSKKVKKAFHKLALIWHPDNINKRFRFCFANKEAYE